VLAEVLPEETEVKKLQERQATAMVGDGVNVPLCPGRCGRSQHRNRRGTPASHTDQRRFERRGTCHLASRKTPRTIKQNSGLFSHVVLIPAALGYLNPMLARNDSAA
jgi:cation transport ATPase